MSGGNASAVERLASLIKERNEIDAKIAALIGRPAMSGHIGEFVASRVFGVTLESDATTAGHDGHFAAGPLVGKTVNIKAYGKRENVLDINPKHVPDYFLVLAGPRTTQATSRGGHRPWVTKARVFPPSPIAPLKLSGEAIRLLTPFRGGEMGDA